VPLTDPGFTRAPVRRRSASMWLTIYPGDAARLWPASHPTLLAPMICRQRLPATTMATRTKTTKRSAPAQDRSLRRTFRLEDLRPGQAAVIRSVLEGHDTLAVMPTGAGKSLCSQLTALQLETRARVPKGKIRVAISLLKERKVRVEGPQRDRPGKARADGGVRSQRPVSLAGAAPLLPG
jgi:hypothetical protein